MAGDTNKHWCGWKKIQKLTSEGTFILHSKSKHYFYNLILKYFVNSIFSTNKYKNFDFKLNANKRGQTYKFTSVLKNISPEKSTTADKGIPYGGTVIDSFINS